MCFIRVQYSTILVVTRQDERRITAQIRKEDTHMSVTLKRKQRGECIGSPLSNAMPAQCAAMYHCLHMTTLALTSWCGVRRLYKHWPHPGQWMCLPSHRYRSHGREMAGANIINTPVWRAMTFENMAQGKLKLIFGLSTYTCIGWIFNRLSSIQS